MLGNGFKKKISLLSLFSLRGESSGQLIQNNLVGILARKGKSIFRHPQFHHISQAQRIKHKTGLTNGDPSANDKMVMMMPAMTMIMIRYLGGREGLRRRKKKAGQINPIIRDSLLLY